MPQPYDQSLFSLNVNDPDNVELIEMFLCDLPSRVEMLRKAADESDFVHLCRLSHQLKGAAPGFGCDPIGASAAVLESTLRDRDSSEIPLDKMRIELDALIESCQPYIKAA